MNLLESLIYGLISGLSEFLPISCQGHQALLKHIFGEQSHDPIRDILVHIAMLAAVIVASGTYLDRIRRERKLKTSRRRGMTGERTVSQEMRLIRTAMIPMLLGIVFYIFAAKLGDSFGWLTLFFAINGLILYIPEHLAHANKGAGQLGPLDSLLIGVFGGLSVLPGISRVGGSLSCAIARGADHTKAYNWILILSIPALILLVVLDIISIFIAGFGQVSLLGILGCFISAIAAFAAAYSGIYFMRRLLSQSGIIFFSFYCWGIALLSFFLYLFV